MEIRPPHDEEPPYISPFAINPEQQTAELEAFRDGLSPKIADVVARIKHTDEMKNMPISPEPISLFDPDSEDEPGEDDLKSFPELSRAQQDIAVLLLLQHLGIENIEDAGIGKRTGINVPVPKGPNVQVRWTRLYPTPQEGLYLERNIYKDKSVGWAVVRADEEYIKGSTS